jgi:hypothetical protein
MINENLILSAALRVGLTFELPPTKLFEFAELIAAAEREHNLRTLAILIDAAVITEREACAEVCENIDETLDPSAVGNACATAIRARGRG